MTGENGTGGDKGPRRRGLGMGLSSLLGADPASFGADEQLPRTVPIEFLRPSPLQPRRRFDEAELAALTESVRDKGVLQPLLVRPAAGGPAGYEIVAGERRWRAAQRAGLHEVPVVVRALADRETLELALVENVQRADLDPIEEAEALRRLQDDFGRTQEALAGLVGKSRSHVANTLRLLALPASVRELLVSGALTAGHARALLAARAPETIALEVTGKGLSVRATEVLVRREGSRAVANTATSPDPDVTELEERLTRSLGLRVGINQKGAGGTLTIRWSDHSQLDGLLTRLR